MADLRNYVLLVDKQGKEVLPVTDGKAVFVEDGSVKLNDKLSTLEGSIGTNASEIARVESEYKDADALLDGKISGLEGRVGVVESDKADKTQVAQDIATAKQELQANIDLKANVADLKSAAYKEVGTLEGQIPVLGANGKLDESMIPAIAINEHFDADDQEAAMLLPVQNGDMVFIVDTTYICVNALESTFEKRFRPLTSVNDSITRGEVESKLANKVENSVFEAYKGEVDGKLATKVENSDLEAYKLQVQAGLDEKALKSEVGVVGTLATTAKVVVDAINEVKGVADGAEAKATQNASDLADYKVEVQGKLDGKADAVHTHDQYALKAEMGEVASLSTVAKDTVVNAINEVKGMADANASAVATKVEQSAFDSYKEEVTGALALKADASHVQENYALKTEVSAVESKVDANTAAIALKADQSALEELGGELAGCIRFRVFNIESETLV